MKLKKCDFCEIYTLEENCPNCNKPTSDAHYKYIKNPIKDSDASIEEDA